MNNLNYKLRKYLGFTLVETMMVVLIGTFIFGTVWTIFREQSAYYTYNMTKTELEKDALIALTYLSRDLRMAKDRVEGMMNKVRMKVYRKIDIDDYNEMASDKLAIVQYEVVDNKLMMNRVYFDGNDENAQAVEENRPIANNILYLKLKPMKNGEDNEDVCPFEMKDDQYYKDTYGNDRWSEMKTNAQKRIDEWHAEKDLMKQLADAGLTVPKLDASSVLVGMVAGKQVWYRGKNKLITKEVVSRVYMRYAIFSELESSWIDNEKLMAGRATGINLAALFAALNGDLSKLSIEELLQLREDVKEALNDTRDDYDDVVAEKKAIEDSKQEAIDTKKEYQRILNRCAWYQWSKKRQYRELIKAQNEIIEIYDEELTEINKVEASLRDNVSKLEQGLQKIDNELRRRLAEAKG